MAADKVEFELVSPERLLLSQQVDMVVVPGAEGDFGVLPRHALLISTLRPGVIRIFEGREVKERIFVAGGFAEVTPERCTVLAEEAQRVGDIDTGKIDQELKDLGEDLADAKTDEEKAAIAKRIGVRQAMRAAAAPGA
jgi:F-type H+-transporting ATPase subunit epsilon